MARLRTPNSNLVKALCDAKGWGANELAEKASVSLQTAYKALNGDGMFRSKLARIANSLKVSVGNVLDPSDPEHIPMGSPEPKHTSTVKTPTFTVTLTIEGDAESVGDSELLRTINRFLTIIGAHKDTEPGNIRYASIHVAFDLEMELAIRCVEALAEHALAEIGITYISIRNLCPFHTVRTDQDFRSAYYAEMVHCKINPDRVDEFAEGMRKVSWYRRFARETKFPMLHTVFSYFDAGKIEIDFSDPDWWDLRATIPAPLIAPGATL